MGRKRRRATEPLVLEYRAEDDPILLTRGLQPGDQVKVKTHGLSKKGDGLARVCVRIGPQGEPRTYDVQIRRALPHEVVDVVLESRRRLRFAARVRERVEASPHRISPRCQHFGERETPGKGCGGCSLQSLSYEEQLGFKQQHVEDLLRKVGLVFDAVAEPLAMETPYYYRNKMEFSFGDDRERRFACGLYPQGWHNEVINLEACFLQSETSDEIRTLVRQWCELAGLATYNGRNNTGFLRNLVIREGKGTGECLVELITSGDEEVTFRGTAVVASEVAKEFAEYVADNLGEVVTTLYWTQHVAIAGQKTRLVEHLLWGKPTLTEKFILDGGREITFGIQPRSFFQPNTTQGQRLASLVGHLALLGHKPRKVLDLYCGAGNLALCVAPFAEEVMGVELVASAVEDARSNAKLNGMSNVSFVASDVGAWLETEEGRAWTQGVDLVLLDPPRAGLIGAATEHVRAIGASRIVYVSCNPQALARDLVSIVDVGYRIDVVQPVDMFPHTPHIETVVLLSKVEMGDG